MSWRIYEKTVDDDYHNLSFSIPNLIHDSVPKGTDESFNKQVRTWGQIPKFDFDVKDHIDLGLNLDIIDLERASKTAGARFLLFERRISEIRSSINWICIRFLLQKKIII